MMDLAELNKLIASIEHCIGCHGCDSSVCLYLLYHGQDHCEDALMDDCRKAIVALYTNKKDQHYVTAKTTAHWLDLCSANCGYMCKVCPFKDCSEQLLRTAEKLLLIAKNEIEIKRQEV